MPVALALFIAFYKRGTLIFLDKHSAYTDAGQIEILCGKRAIVSNFTWIFAADFGHIFYAELFLDIAKAVYSVEDTAARVIVEVVLVRT